MNLSAQALAQAMIPALIPVVTAVCALIPLAGTQPALAQAGARIMTDDTARAANEAVAHARKRWAESPHGPMLERILPPAFAASKLPEAGSRGARVMVQYCVQCHNLPNPAMHHAAKWPSVVARMLPRMQGRGNMGVLMKDMMSGVSAPNTEETEVLNRYLRKHAQAPLDPARYPDLDSRQAESFRIACQQCHTLPDPKRHTAAQWPEVVARMEQNMAWMNRMVGSAPNPGEPQLKVEDINAWLAKHARRR